MRLVETKAKLEEVMLDNFNPRFKCEVIGSQEQVIAELQKGEKSRELLTSMLTEIRWVNKIVVVEIQQLSEKEKEKYRKIDLNFENKYKYIVVEGNTRISCLYHPDLKKKFDAGELIPVIVAVREDGESDNSFLQERKRLQNIANVMVVKEWSDISKAKQLHSSFKLIQEINPDKTEREIIKELADSLGVKPTVVRNFVYRYAFYKELVENGANIEEKDFKFLEGLHQNSVMTSNFGLDNKKMEFEWNIEDENEEISEDVETKQQLLNMFPQVMEIAKDEKISSKALRDILRKHKEEGVEGLFQKFVDLCEYSLSEDYANDGFAKVFKLEEGNDEELRVENNIKSAIKTLKNFPLNADYAVNFKEDIKKIKALTERIITFMDMYEDENEENRAS